MELNEKDIEDILPLMPTGEGILFEYLQQPKSDMYFEQLCLYLAGPLQEACFISAWEHVQRKNEVLRSIFRWEKLNKPLQVIVKDVKLDYHSDELSGESELERYKLADRTAGFDLSTVPFRLRLFKLGPDKFALLLSYHHILFDGWSLGIILREFFTAYRSLALTEELPITHKPKVKEYIKWQQNQEKRPSEHYWKEYLHDYEPKNFHIGRDCPKSEAHTESYEDTLPTTFTGQLAAFAQEQQTTPAVVFYAALCVLLHKYMNSEDILYGIAVSGREGQVPGVENLVGLFIKTLPLRINTTAQMKIAELLQRISSALQLSEKHQNVSLSELKGYCGLTKENLFNLVVGVENYPLDRLLMEEDSSLHATDYSFSERAGFDLSLTITMLEEIKLSFRYNAALFSLEEMRRMAGHVEKALGDMIAGPERTLADFELVTPGEKAEILSTFNQSLPDWAGEKTISELFLAQVQRTPENVAVSYAGEVVTYRELNWRANRLARSLQKKGVGPEKVVGLLLTRSLEMVVGIIAVLKAGGAYLPLEIDLPEERIRFLLSDSGAAVLLTERKLNKAKELPPDLIFLDEDINEEDGSDFDSASSPANLAYIIYTSGSTGLPKGVMIEHRNGVSLFTNLKLFNISEETWTLFHSYSFDFSVWEMFGAFFTGSKLIIVPKELTVNPEKYYQFLSSEKVTILNQTPSVFYSLIAEDLSKPENRLNPKVVFLGGEALNFARIETWCAKYPAAKLINLYGATENTVYTAWKEINSQAVEENVSNIGKPIPTMQIYILDASLHLLPVGVAGELCISGRGLARGYLNRAEVTREKFIANPYCPGERLYRTGDLARWLPTGELEYLARLDQQVKIRGYRIEIGEVENRLLQHPDVKEAAVLADGSYLTAYVVTETEISPAELRTTLSNQLPEYMVPASFISLQKLPVTANGKLDRKALLALLPEISDQAEKILPCTETEEKLALIWQNVLGLKEKPGVNESFFAHGGHSLNAIQVIGRIEKEFAVKLTPQEFFQAPVIAELASLITGAERGRYQEIPSIEKRPHYPLSYNQRRLWANNQIEPDSLAYNISGKLTFHQRVDEEALMKALQVLFARHESLRTRFAKTAEGPVQIVEEHVEVPLYKVDIALIPVSERPKRREEVYEAAMTTIFDLQKPPLMQITLVIVTPEECDLLFNMHHIISDGWSVEVLKKEFNYLYESYQAGLKVELKPLQVQYRDFAVYQSTRYPKAVLDEPAYQYWKARLAGGLPVLELPYDHPVTLKSRNNAGYRFVLPAELHLDLTLLAKENQFTLFTPLFAAFNLMLTKFTGQNEVVVGVPSAGREQPEVQDLVGFFINTTIIKNSIDHTESFRDFCRRVNQECLLALQYQNYPLELVLSELKQRYPEIPVFFNLLNLSAQSEELAVFTPYHFKTTQEAKFDLIYYLSEYPNGIEIVCNYRSVLFKPETIEYFAQEYAKILQYLVQNPAGNFTSFRQSNKKKIF